jgi:hypothetical protein
MLCQLSYAVRSVRASDISEHNLFPSIPIGYSHRWHIYSFSRSFCSWNSLCRCDPRLARLVHLSISVQLSIKLLASFRHLDSFGRFDLSSMIVTNSTRLSTFAGSTEVLHVIMYVIMCQSLPFFSVSLHI